jgi:hypothetical protein
MIRDLKIFCAWEAQATAKDGLYSAAKVRTCRTEIGDIFSQIWTQNDEFQSF